MGPSWIDTTQRDAPEACSKAFWERHRGELESGRFWADRIKSEYGNPAERLRIALENIPLPGAFGEAAIATRALIRAKRKSNEDWSDELGLLYWLAAIASFSVPYLESLREPGFNVLESIPGEVVRGLSFTYQELGHVHLALLSRTDVKWLEERWGTPRTHSTLHYMHRAVWLDYEQRLVARRAADKAKFTAELLELVRGGGRDG